MRTGLPDLAEDHMTESTLALAMLGIRYLPQPMAASSELPVRLRLDSEYRLLTTVCLQMHSPREHPITLHTITCMA
jgi:hypothetical protein